MPHKVDTYFHVGDIVHVRRDLRPFERYHMDGDTGNTNIAVPEMIRIAGEKVVIKDIIPAAAGIGHYQYRIYHNIFDWTDEMFDEYINGESDHPQLVAEGDAAILEFISANKI